MRQYAEDFFDNKHVYEGIKGVYFWNQLQISDMIHAMGYIVAAQTVP